MVDSAVLLLHALSFIRRLAVICILLNFVRGKGEMLKIIIRYLCACSNFNAVMQRRKEGGGSCNYTHDLLVQVLYLYCLVHLKGCHSNLNALRQSNQLINTRVNASTVSKSVLL